MEDARVPVKDLVLIPAVITLAVTLLRLVGELQNWSPVLFNKSAGGGGSLVGISWLIPVFGAYFAVRLVRAGHGPAGPGRALGISVLAVALNFGMLFLAIQVLKLSSPGRVGTFVLGSVLGVFVAFPAWKALSRTLLAYAFAARIPVVLVMLFAILGNWGTHYDVAPPDEPLVATMTPLVKWFWIGLVPQLTAWIFMTVVGGLVFGSIAAMVVRPKAV
jgi:hypothetical protein